MSSSHIHTQQVGRSFSAASESYDAHAVLQREIANRLLAHLDFTKIEPQRMLDIGCGTGYFTRLLRTRYKRAELVAFDLSPAMLAHARSAHALRMPWHGRHHHVGGDAALLPFKAGSFDLVCSNLAMQWVSDPQLMLSEMRRVLAPGGLMLFSTFGRRTLSELRQTLASIEPERAGHVLPFPDVMSLGDALMKLPVEMPVTDSDLFTLTYPDVMALVRELKGLGASASAIRGRRAGLYGRALIKALEQRYPERYQMEDGRLSATFEALYGQAWYKEAGYEHGDCVIPIQQAGV
ncbi:MAG: malonyl-[acyl-carrier protein] O-methyltransferase BioC [Zetaproteobacteria bacterium CG12_big_fil_rev_8_21_14_0_65_54_13]|nr:MAG: malonyl-[acyl-carrier protein] O-methyltransferase BioC [Zetaproteobacteria bacterium CG23_combo_of_CG06-09_8_20_14_all_54_7]PIW48267.1 MAG: malonyl-[acyl-carrier protein] O-methyltransferase BioC [Zetaproteobacteria bacterium CG12_big_fil_rev_8_21_14_0_65_54_13]PIX54567.1 MAG: malonyl-[acyl-carrier protein] O-methyltransferase BioC [Zetaproteobacteria bacterium CG_4_10_14_3_um_filter_54_28]PJA29715.1 MAG: malonyl-[acyl-carrier protein] O-methyltransferase BioC [Zetaproteobacteria bacter